MGSLSGIGTGGNRVESELEHKNIILQRLYFRSSHTSLTTCPCWWVENHKASFSLWMNESEFIHKLPHKSLHVHSTITMHVYSALHQSVMHTCISAQPVDQLIEHQINPWKWKQSVLIFWLGLSGNGIKWEWEGMGLGLHLDWVPWF